MLASSLGKSATLHVVSLLLPAVERNILKGTAQSHYEFILC